MPEKSVTLHTMLGNYPNTKALKSGAFRSDLIDFDFVDVKVANNLFKQIVRDAKYDVGRACDRDLSAGQDLRQALRAAAGRAGRAAASTTPSPTTPIAACSSRPISPASASACAPTRSPPAPGCAAFSPHDYGVDLDKVEWITFEDPHVAEYRDPPIIKRAPPGKELVQMLLDGEIDAAVVGDKLPDPRLKHLIPDADAVARSGRERTTACRSTTWWSCARSCQQSRPDVVREVFRLLRREQARRGVAGRWNAARSAPLRGRSLPAQPGDHHRLLPPAAADPSAPLRSTSCSTTPPAP